MGRKKIETIIKEKIHPYTLSDIGIANISNLTRNYEYDLLLECIDIGVKNYFAYDDSGKLTRDSVEIFIQKLGGIAYNKSKSKIEQQIRCLIKTGRSIFSYWDDKKASQLLEKYVYELKKVK